MFEGHATDYISVSKPVIILVFFRLISAQALSVLKWLILSNELEAEVMHKKGKLETAKSERSGDK